MITYSRANALGCDLVGIVALNGGLFLDVDEIDSRFVVETLDAIICR